MIRKALFAVFLAILGPIPSFAASIGINSFSGLDSQDPPSALQPSQSQDLLNVRIQPGGHSVTKRDGYGLFQTLNSVSTAAVHGGYHFQQTGGADVQLWGSDAGLYASVSDASFIRVATGTVGSTWQCTDNLGFAYCVTSSGVDTPVKTDGSVANTSYRTEIPIGTMITSTPLQLVVAGVAGNPSTLYVSANNNFLSFTPGPLPTDPYQEIINSPGSRLTNIGFYFGNLYWWKDQSVGYVSGSGSQSSVGITIISNQIGTLDNSSAFWNPTTYDQGNKFNTGAQTTTSGNPYFNEMASLGGIFFRGQDNHVYQYDGYTLTRLSRIITPNITTSSRRKASSWTQTTPTDFASGSLTNIDTSTVVGSIALPGYSDSFSSLSNWTSIQGSWTVVTGGVRVSSSTGPGLIRGAIHGPLMSSFPGSTTWYATTVLGIAPQFTPENLRGCVGIVNVSTQGYHVCLEYTGSANTIDLIITNADFSSFFTGTVSLGTYDGANHSLTLGYNTTSGFLTAYWDGIAEATATNSLYTGLIFPSLWGNCGVSDPTNNRMTFASAGVRMSSGSFSSIVDNAPNLTSWGNYIANDLTNGGSINYFTRSSTSSFTISSSTPVWVSQPKNSLVSVSTGTYFQTKIDFSVNSGTESPSTSDFTFNWFEGTAGDKAYIQYFQDAILFSVSSGSSTSKNNTIFYLDLLNNTWLKDDIASNGFAVENNALYIGDPLSAKVYKFGGVQTDNSLPIHSYWKSMDFMGQDPTTQNSFEQADFAFSQSSTTINYVYAIDQSTSPTTVSIPLYSPNHTLIKRGFALAPGKIGTYYNFKIEDNSSLSPWTLMGQRTTYNPLPWRPQTSQ